MSPHLDDAVLSLGATIAGAARRGASVRIVTVYAGNPEDDGPASEWDALCGFSRAGEAVRARREEDRRACEIVGADPVWLSFPEGADTPELVRSLQAELADADTVLVPGFPRSHPDHRLAAGLVERMQVRCAGYVEQPYAMWRLLGDRPETGSRIRNGLALALRRRLELPAAGVRPLRHALRDGRAKRRAVQAYESQLRGFGRLVAPGIALYEWGFGGEGIVEA